MWLLALASLGLLLLLLPLPLPAARCLPLLVLALVGWRWVVLVLGPVLRVLLLVVAVVRFASSVLLQRRIRTWG